MKIRLFTILLVAFFILSSCSDSNDTGSDMGSLNIQLTDAPFPHDLVAEANVTIFKVDARNKEANIDSSEEGKIQEGGESSFVVLMEGEIQVNLLELTNGVTETLVDTEIPVGSYDLVRLYVKGINVVLTDGTTFDLKVPSGEQSGIKVFIKPGITVTGGLTSDLLLDFDVSRSFVPQGDAKNLKGILGFNFKPVIKASNMSTSGTLEGKVTTFQEETAVGLKGAQISVFAADTLNTTTFTDETGAYMVMGLLAGSYDVTVDLEGYEFQTVQAIGIKAANKTVQDFELNIAETEEGN